MLVAHNAPFDIGFLKAAAARTGHEWPRFHGPRHRPPGPPARDPRRGAATTSCPPWPSSSARPTTPDHRALHDARATVDVLHAPARARRQPRRRHPRGAVELLLPGQPRPAPQALPRRGPAVRAGVYLFKDAPAAACSTSARRATSARASAATSPPPSSAPGWPRWCGIAESVTPVVCHTTLEAEVRELRLIAEHKPRYNRRSRHPERALWVKLTVEAVPPPVASSARSGTTAPATSARSPRATSAESGRSPRCTRWSRCGSAPDGCRHARRSPPARSPRWAAAARRAPGRRASTTTPPWSPRRRAALGGDARDVVAALHARMACWPGRSASRTPAPCATGCCTSSAPPRAPSGSPRSPPPPRSWPPGARADGGWEVVSSATAASPARRQPARRRPDAVHRRPDAPAPRSSRPAGGPAPAATPGGDREGPALARGCRACGSSRLEGEWTCPVHGAGAARARARAAGRRAARRGGVRRAGVRRPSPAPARTSARDGVRPPWR